MCEPVMQIICQMIQLIKASPAAYVQSSTTGECVRHLFSDRRGAASRMHATQRESIFISGADLFKGLEDLRVLVLRNTATSVLDHQLHMIAIRGHSYHDAPSLCEFEGVPYQVEKDLRDSASVPCDAGDAVHIFNYLHPCLGHVPQSVDHLSDESGHIDLHPGTKKIQTTNYSPALYDMSIKVCHRSNV